MRVYYIDGGFLLNIEPICYSISFQTLFCNYQKRLAAHREKIISYDIILNMCKFHTELV